LQAGTRTPMARRKTHLMKHSTLGEARTPRAVLVTYRTRKDGKPATHYRTLIIEDGRHCTVLDWPDETTALSGHEQTLARLGQHQPIIEELKP
jgi:hypothetical protein